MIDTHAHLEENQKIKIDKVVLAASDLEDSIKNIELAKNNPKQFFASVGIHPQCTDPENKLSIKEQLNLLEELIKNNKVIAIGECGLDYSPAPPEEKDRSREEQEELFKGQIELAQKYDLPLIIHARKAVDETVEILKNYKNLRGVFHCYAGGKKRIQKILDLGKGWYFGIDGNITYEEGLIEVVKNMPKNRLLVETDSPYLTPIPFRNETNKPDYVEFIYKKVAEIWEMSFEEIEKIIDANAKKLFKV